MKKPVWQLQSRLKAIVDKGVQVAIVIGGGNFWRGRTSNKIDRPKADGIGMLSYNYELYVCIRDLSEQKVWTQMYIHHLHVEHGQSLFSKDEAVADLNAWQGCVLCRRNRSSIFLNRYDHGT